MGVDYSRNFACAFIRAWDWQNELRRNALDWDRRYYHSTIRIGEIRFRHLCLGVYGGRYAINANIQRPVANTIRRRCDLPSYYAGAEYVRYDVRWAIDVGDAFFRRNEN